MNIFKNNYCHIDKLKEWVLGKKDKEKKSKNSTKWTAIDPRNVWIGTKQNNNIRNYLSHIWERKQCLNKSAFVKNKKSKNQKNY